MANTKPELPRQIRVSIGTAIAIGLLEGKLDAEPTTAYLMTYHQSKCRANCTFCPQARNSQSSAELLSRITWPQFPTATVINAIQNAVENEKILRVCIQALNYPDVIQHLITLVKTIKNAAAVPISISCQPQNRENIQKLADAGAERISIAIDASTSKLFSQTKGIEANGPYTWRKTLKLLRDAVEIFGKNHVTTHLIIGLGETEKQAANAIQKLADYNIQTALFAFTPVRGTFMQNRPQPDVAAYRRIQLARYLITNRQACSRNFTYDGNGKITSYHVEENTLHEIVASGKPFQTTGCPDCNRPYYNEKPTGPIYNHPEPLSPEEIATIKNQLKLTRLRASAFYSLSEASVSDV
ncbi:radical SAM protein [Candidatus Bathyarchaeota archaeon A05DMB-2]|nr:radical SAM protein [Candidatus Bathyarchaeota archaeon A05DMB-2]